MDVVKTKPNTFIQIKNYCFIIYEYVLKCQRVSREGITNSTTGYIVLISDVMKVGKKVLLCKAARCAGLNEHSK